MTQYIDKSALVAEIERFIKKNELYLDDNASDEVRFQKTGAYSVLCDLRHFIDTIEVKDVDLEQELDFVKDAYYYFTSDERSSMKKVAKDRDRKSVV